MSVKHGFEDTLRVHDTAFFRWLGGLRVDYGDGGGLFSPPKNDVEIIRVFSTPERAFADVLEALAGNRWLTLAQSDHLRSTSDITALPMPFITVSRADPVHSSEMAQVPETIRGTTDDPETGLPFVYPFPSHALTDYTASVRCHKRYTESFIKEWVFSQMGPLGCQQNECLIPVEHNAPFGTMRQRLQYQGSSDQTETEGTDARYFVFDFSFTLRTWIMKAAVTSWGGIAPDR